jgi:molybdate transport system ATP-binding protein
MVQRDDFHLQVDLETAGGVLVLFGPSGAGKSTILQAIAGLLTPRAGEITLGGEVLFRRDRQGPKVNLPARHRRAGYVFQDYALFPHLTALDNVAYPLWHRPGAKDRALNQLRRVDLADLAHRYPHQLSGGQQQRVAIARALNAAPRILLLDEPFAALDLETRRRLRSQIKRILEETNIPTILVTHDREEALALGDEVQVIDRGRQLERGRPLNVLGQPGQGRVARLVGVENLLPLSVIARLPQDGTMLCGGLLQLEVPLSDFSVGDMVTVGIRASDIILATEEPRGSSARNRLRGRVSAVELRPPGYQVRLDCQGTALQCHITGRSLEELGITEGMELWAVFKASSCFLVGRESLPAESPGPGTAPPRD